VLARLLWLVHKRHADYSSLASLLAQHRDAAMAHAVTLQHGGWAATCRHHRLLQTVTPTTAAKLLRHLCMLLSELLVCLEVTGCRLTHLNGVLLRRYLLSKSTPMLHVYLLQQVADSGATTLQTCRMAGLPPTGWTVSCTKHWPAANYIVCWVRKPAYIGVDPLVQGHLCHAGYMASCEQP
jgi:hypothetical protein